MRYWLIKSEPETFSIIHLCNTFQKTTSWEGVRNYQARNYLCEMQLGDQAFFYHSNCSAIGIYGVVEISQTAYPDPYALDPHSPYFDLKSTPTQPRWFMVDIKLVTAFSSPILLTTIKEHVQSDTLPLLQRGHRLSVMPVNPIDWQHIYSLYTQSSS